MTKLQQHPLLGPLVNPFGRSARLFELAGTNLFVTQRATKSTISLEELVSPPSVEKGLFGASTGLSTSKGQKFILRGTRFSDARVFSDEVKASWIDLNLHARVVNLERPTTYPAACVITPLLKDVRALDAALPSKLNPEAITASSLGLSSDRANAISNIA